MTYSFDVLRIISFIVGIRLLVLNLTFLFIPLYLEKLGLSGFMSGLLMSLFFITGILFSPGVGVMTDRIRIKWMIVCGGILCSLFFGGLAFSLPGLFFLFIIGGLGNNLFEISATSILVKESSAISSGRTYGIYHLAIMIFASIGICLSGYAISYFSFKMVFGITALVFLLLPVLSVSLDNFVKVSTAAEYKRDFFRREVAVFLVVIFLFVMHHGAEQTCLTLYFRDYLGFDLKQTGLFLGLVLPALGFSALVSGIGLDRKWFSIKTILVTGIFLSGIGSAGFYSRNTWLVFVFRLLHESGDGLMGVFFYMGLSRLFPRERAGGLSALVTSVMIIGRFTGSVIFSTIGKGLGYETSIILSGIVSVLLVPAVVIFVKNEKRGIQ